MLSRWRIRYKLILGVSLLVAVVATLSGSGLWGLYAFRGLAKGLSWRVEELPLAGELDRRGVDPQEFVRGWVPVGAFRLLQALGAFAKLGGRFGKPGFLEHAATGLAHLCEHLGEVGRDRYPALWTLVAAARDAWETSTRRP